MYRYLFWTERGGFIRYLSLATNATLALEMSVTDPFTIILDCINEKIYGFVKKSEVDYISASDYDDGNQTTIANGTFNPFLLGVFGNLLYFISESRDRSYIEEMKVSNESLSRKIAVDKNDYYSLIVAHSSLQPMGEL